MTPIRSTRDRSPVTSPTCRAVPPSLGMNPEICPFIAVVRCFAVPGVVLLPDFDAMGEVAFHPLGGGHLAHHACGPGRGVVHLQASRLLEGRLGGHQHLGRADAGHRAIFPAIGGLGGHLDDGPGPHLSRGLHLQTRLVHRGLLHGDGRLRLPAPVGQDSRRTSRHDHHRGGGQRHLRPLPEPPGAAARGDRVRQRAGRQRARCRRRLRGLVGGGAQGPDQVFFASHRASCSTRLIRSLSRARAA